MLQNIARIARFVLRLPWTIYSRQVYTTDAKNMSGDREYHCVSPHGRRRSVALRWVSHRKTILFLAQLTLIPYTVIITV